MLDKNGDPLVVLEAKKESIDPLSAKEQALNYARNKGARFIILSNGNIHYFLDTKHGNPQAISKFPTQESLTQYKQYTPNPQALAKTQIDENYIVATQIANFASDPDFINETTRAEFLKSNNAKQLRPYQVKAIKALQEAVKNGKQRFLFEMATGTGKTLISAAVIKLFLESSNAKRILFLVDRIELEDQAQKAFKQYLGRDYNSVIFKESRDSWRQAEIVVSTIQSFMANDRYKKEFSPTDFELVISDEAHRSIGGNSRAVFEYFVGYKLGLTATPKNYLKGIDSQNQNSQKEYERRILLDTYKTFGCEIGEPTFSYDLIQGSQDKYLIQPTLVDARTRITTQLLSEEGYSVHKIEDGEEINQSFNERHYERKFFNEETNIAMCKAFIDNGLKDPIASQLGAELFGKSIVFCVSQSHAARITNILNKLALEKWPNQYGQSDFAKQITSHVQNAQQMTINFANNALGGRSNLIEGYETSKTRVAVTVGMMTTGYDCQDLLNIGLMRPVFSPSDFVQIKGRGTRKFQFEYKNYLNKEKTIIEKSRFKFFDFFASCEYFEKEFNYDDKLELPQITRALNAENNEAQEEFIDEQGNKIFKGIIDLNAQDEITSISQEDIGEQGMRIDREGFKKAVEEDVSGNETLKNMWQNGDYEEAEEFTKKNIFDKPKYFLNLEKIRRIFNIDRRINIKEFLQFAFGEKDGFEMKDELLEKEWQKFVDIYHVEQQYYWPVKNLFKAYIGDKEIRDIVDNKDYAKLDFTYFDCDEFIACNGFQDKVPQYIRDYAYHLTNL